MNLRVPFVISAASFAALLLAGCGEKPADTSTTATPVAAASPAAGTTAVAVNTGKPQGSVKIGDKALCAVCAVKEGTTAEEEVKATLDYKGMTYAFCNDAEKAEFISNPTKYVQAK